MRGRTTFVIMVTAGLMSMAVVTPSIGAYPRPNPGPQAMELDLAKPFHARSAWRLVVSEGPPVKDLMDDAPGALTLCLRKGEAGPCISDPVTLAALRDPTSWGPHYLLSAKIVYPQGPDGAPLLLILTGSLISADGDQFVTTLLADYDAGRDSFRRVYGKSTGHNNNQDVRLITDGPLRGSVISAEPEQHLPYGYWIEVSQPAPAGEYRRVLRYVSATRYNDGNALAVIDSEMPNIERRLGLWKPGDPIPTPGSGSGGGPCPNPVLRHTELWCR